jgi:hypothetical protein
MTAPVWAEAANTVQISGQWFVDPSWEGGGGKWNNCSDCTIDGLNSYENGGGGFSWDINNHHAVVRNSVIHDNRAVSHAYEAIGLSFEISSGPCLIENNQFWNNSGGHIMVISSGNVTVRGNRFAGDFIGLTNWNRGAAAWYLHDVSVTDNVFDASFMWNSGNQSNTYDWPLNAAAAWHLTCDRNLFVNQAQAQWGVAYYWGNHQYSSLAAVRTDLGCELNGRNATDGIANFATTGGTAQASLSWSASPTAVSYVVRRATSSAGPYVTIATGIATTAYVDAGLADATTYYYEISAVKPDGSAVVSASASVHTAAATPVTIPPGTRPVAATPASSAGGDSSHCGRGTGMVVLIGLWLCSCRLRKHSVEAIPGFAN